MGSIPMPPHQLSSLVNAHIVLIKACRVSFQPILESKNLRGFQVSLFPLPLRNLPPCSSVFNVGLLEILEMTITTPLPPTEPQLGDALPGTMQKIKQSCDKYVKRPFSWFRTEKFHIAHQQIPYPCPRKGWFSNILFFSSKLPIELLQEGVGKSSLISHIFKVDLLVSGELLDISCLCRLFHKRYPNIKWESRTSTRKYSQQRTIPLSCTQRKPMDLENSTNWKILSAIEPELPIWVIGYMQSGMYHLDFALKHTIWAASVNTCVGYASQRHSLMGSSLRLGIKKSSELFTEKVSELGLELSRFCSEGPR